MSRKPKPCKVKVYVYELIYPAYHPATELKPFFGLPTLSQAFQEFMEGVHVYLEVGKDFKFNFKDAKPFTLKVNCATARLWEILPNKDKEHLLVLFNDELYFKICQRLGGKAR